MGTILVQIHQIPCPRSFDLDVRRMVCKHHTWTAGVAELWRGVLGIESRCLLVFSTARSRCLRRRERGMKLRSDRIILTHAPSWFHILLVFGIYWMYFSDRILPIIYVESWNAGLERLIWPEQYIRR